VGDHRPGGVEHDGVADRTLGAGQHRAHLGGIGLRVAAQQIIETGSGETESGGIEGQLVHRPGLHPPNRARRGGGQLVEPVVAVHDEHAGPARREHPRHHLGQFGERAADQPGPGPCRIGQRPKEIEDRRHPDLATHRRRVPVRRVKQWREAEPDPDLGEALRDLLGPQVDAHPERLERVGAAGQRRRRPIAVFDHRHARRRDHDRRHGGQVDGVDAIATGADDVDGTGGDVGGRPCRQLEGVAQHDIGQLTDFGRGGDLHLHRHREGGDLGRLRVAGHDLVHRPGGLTPRQFPAARQPRQDLRPRGRPGSSGRAAAQRHSLR